MSSPYGEECVDKKHVGGLESGGGVNLRALAGGGGDGSTSLLVASSIAAGPGVDEGAMGLGRGGGVLNSSLAAAAAAGGTGTKGPSSAPGSSLAGSVPGSSLAAAVSSQMRQQRPPSFHEQQQQPPSYLEQQQQQQQASYHEHQQQQQQAAAAAAAQMHPAAGYGYLQGGVPQLHQYTLPPHLSSGPPPPPPPPPHQGEGPQEVPRHADMYGGPSGGFGIPISSHEQLSEIQGHEVSFFPSEQRPDEGSILAGSAEHQHLDHEQQPGQPGQPDQGQQQGESQEEEEERVSGGSAEEEQDDGVGVDDGSETGPVKLFVGQVPKSLNEEDLFPTFSDFGPIKELLVIRDKHTGQHRGCAFVTFWSAQAAARVQDLLHDQFTFPSARKPVQIRPAAEPSHHQHHHHHHQQALPPHGHGHIHTHGPTPEQENKLFIGQTSRNADENSIRELFAQFGEIREIYIIRNADGSNKGCAFLKFAHRDSCLAAIDALHDNFQMDTATRPLIVKFADTKAQRRARNTNAQRNIHNNAQPINAIANVQQQGQPLQPQTNPYYLPNPQPVPVYPGYQQQGPQVPPPMGMPPHASQYSQAPYSAGYPNVPSGGNPPPPPHNYMYQHPSYSHATPYGYPPSGPPFGPPAQTQVTPPQSQAPDHVFDQHAAAAAAAHQRANLANRQQARPSSRSPKPPSYQQRQEIAGAVNPRPREGPAGANLFIYHLPHDLTDADLATAFNPFGNVISAKVYVDKYTGESKGFGFVSYDSIESAEQAIEQMNGFQIGSKRLKVQHKRVNKPPSAAASANTSQAGSNPADQPQSTNIMPPADQTNDSNQVTLHGLSSQPPPQSLPAANHHHHQQRYHPSLNVEALSNELDDLDVHYGEDDE